MGEEVMKDGRRCNKGREEGVKNGDEGVRGKSGEEMVAGYGRVLKEMCSML